MNSTKDKPMICYGYGKVSSNDFGSYPIFETDRKQNMNYGKYDEWDIQAVTINDKKYALRTDTKGLYDFDSYTIALQNPGAEPDYIGQLVKINGQYKIIPA